MVGWEAGWTAESELTLRIREKCLLLLVALSSNPHPPMTMLVRAARQRTSACYRAHCRLHKLCTSRPHIWRQTSQLSNLATSRTIVGSGIVCRKEKQIFIFTTSSKSALGTNQPPMQWVPSAVWLEIKRQRREAVISPPRNAKVTNVCCHMPSPDYD